MSKIKLPHASGNSMSIAAPATNPASDLELKLPATIGTAGQVLRNSSTPGTLEFGSALQVKQAVNSAQASESVSDGVFEDIAGLSVSITPSSTSSKILVFYKVAMASTKGDYNTYIRIVRDSTAIGIGDQTGSNRPRVSSYISTDSTDYFIAQHTNMFLDSPNTTSPTTYKLQWTDSYSQTFYLNRSVNNTDSKYYPTQISQITVMEVSG